MGKHSITNINYHLSSELNDHRCCVEVSFLFNGKPTKKLMYFQQTGGRNCIKSAKQVVEKELNNGKLAKYAKKYHKKSFVVSKLAVVTTIAVAGAIAIGGFFTWKYLNTDHSVAPKKGDEVKVETEVVDPTGKTHKIELTNQEATVGSNYQTDINLESNATAVALPFELDKVTSYNHELTKEQYAYEFINSTTGKLMIPAEYVKGPVSIGLTLRSLEVTVTMTVNTITRCSVSYNGQTLEEGSIHGSFPTTTTEFIVDSVDPCYVVDNDCFVLKYQDGSSVRHSYREEDNRKILTVDAEKDFTFTVAAAPAAGSVMATATYNSKCSGIYYLLNNQPVEIKKGESLPVVPTSAKKIRFGVTSDDDIDKPTSLEISCDLPGVVINTSEEVPFGSKFIGIVTLNCNNCPSMRDFTLNVHPEEYNKISATITQTNCAKITNNGQQVTYDEPFLVTPEKDDGSLKVVFEVTTIGALLKDADVQCSQDKTVTLIKNNTYRVAVSIEETTEQFTLSVTPESPLSTVNALIEHNEHCSVMYHGVPVPNSEFPVIPVHDDQIDKVVFDAYPRDGTELNNANVWVSDNLSLVEGTEVSVDKVVGTELHYQITISMVHQDGGAFEDFTLYINPGEQRSPFLTVTHADDPTIEANYMVQYYDEEGDLQIAPYDTPVNFLAEEGKMHINIITKAGYAVEKAMISAYLTDEPSVTLTISEINRIERIYQIEFTNTSGLEQMPNITINLLRSELTHNITVTPTFNEGVQSIKFNNQEITEKDVPFTEFETLDESLEFIVDTDGIELNNEGDIKQVTIICPEDPDGKITIESITQDEKTKIYTIVIHAERISDWKSFTLSIIPDIDTTIDTYKTGENIDQAYFRTKIGTTWEYVGNESSPTPLQYKRGLYRYRFSADTIESYGYTINAANTVATIHPKDESIGPVLLTVESAGGSAFYIIFEHNIAKELLNTDGIESIELNNHVDAVPVVATINFDSELYEISYQREKLTSGQQLSLGAGTSVLSTIELYVKAAAEITMDSTYVTVVGSRNALTTSITRYESIDYNYIITLSGMNYKDGTFSVNIGEPVKVIMDDEGYEQVTFANGSQTTYIGLYNNTVYIECCPREGYHNPHERGMQAPTVEGPYQVSFSQRGFQNNAYFLVLGAGQVFRTGMILTCHIACDPIT